ncbi:MAG: MJ1255/VC2487 family glycosyltransferase [Deltaproteobacteria bacterium]
MKILYGVVGEGMGHATRSKVTIEHLVARGHSVKIVVSGRAHDFLEKSFPDVVEIRGLEIKYLDGAMDRDASVAKNLLAAPQMLLENMSAYYEDVKSYAPDAVISDFESFAYLYAQRHRIPCLSIDNQQVISRCRHDDDILEGHQVDFQSTKAFIKLKLPGCVEYVITTFFYPPIKEKYAHNTTLVPPILREQVLAAKPTDGDHVLVYQTSTSDTRLLDVLNAATPEQFVVYGLRRDEIHGNCVVKNFSEQGFIDDLASARAVIANGGLSLIGEALYLGKPVYCIPVKHQFEQVMNSRYITKLGYGMSSEAIEPDVLGAFLRDAPHFARRVRADHRQEGNKLLFDKVDSVLASIEQGA